MLKIVEMQVQKWRCRK